MGEAQPVERTFVMIKPDGVQRKLIAPIMQRFERKGLQLEELVYEKPSRDKFAMMYRHLSDRPYFNDILDFMCSGPVCIMVWSGINAVKKGRCLLGETDPDHAQPGTIRGDFGTEIRKNVCHASDSVESASQEIKLWFPNHPSHALNLSDLNQLDERTSATFSH